MNISQLEGIINGNSNITGDQAKLILNRVNGTNRTEIEGAMEAVGKELINTDKPIYLIAQESGFSNLNYFYKKFNAYFSGFPADYRKQFQAK